MINLKTEEELIKYIRYNTIYSITNFLIGCFLVILSGTTDRIILGFAAVALFTASILYYVDMQTNIVRFELRKSQ